MINAGCQDLCIKENVRNVTEIAYGAQCLWIGILLGCHTLVDSGQPISVLIKLILTK